MTTIYPQTKGIVNSLLTESNESIICFVSGEAKIIFRDPLVTIYEDAEMTFAEFLLLAIHGKSIKI